MTPRVSDERLAVLVGHESVVQVSLEDASNIPVLLRKLALDLRDERAAHRRDVDAANATIKRLQRELDDAVAKEREACAGVAVAAMLEASGKADRRAECGDGIWAGIWQNRQHEAKDIAAAIRARGNERKGA